MTASLPPIVQQALQASAAGNTEAALQLLRSAINELPGDALPHFLMGAEHAQAQQIAEAEAAYAQAVLLAPGFDMARFQLGLLQFTSGRTMVALVTWQPLFNLPPTHALQRFVSAFGALTQGRLADAAEFCRLGMTLNHDNPPLNVDMQLLIDRIAQLQITTQESDAVPSADNAHVLLANYRQQDSLH
jgi:tetratricopeptide (TPR) repeat protein